mmetsp:Transcript_8122/g.12148  ORF Transcript_8122/g.12148 Transcript_8122/m.12148 type:complete len:428 (-) Transcript_8122:510-1793(-)
MKKNDKEDVNNNKDNDQKEDDNKNDNHANNPKEETNKPSSSSSSSQNNNIPPPPKKKRAICSKCTRPTPAACICAALPPSLLTFQNCRVLILQHPHELKRKNRSIPLIQLCCASGKDEESGDFNMEVVVKKRLGKDVPTYIMKMLKSEEEDVVLLYPGKDAVSLKEGLEIIEQRRKERDDKKKQQQQKEEEESKEENTKESEEKDAEENDAPSSKDETKEKKKKKKMTLVFLDATWKYAREMEKFNTSMNYWKKDIVRVKLDPVNDVAADKTNNQTFNKQEDDKTTLNEDDDESKAAAPADEQKDTTTSSNNSNSTTNTTKSYQPKSYTPNRFHIRTPPSSQHLSTAECIAWMVSIVENKPELYDTLMKPLDLMVEKWSSFTNNRGGQGGATKRGFTDGDGAFEEDGVGSGGGGGRRGNQKRQRRGT